jgi:hypothetical protein
MPHSGLCNPAESDERRKPGVHHPVEDFSSSSVNHIPDSLARGVDSFFYLGND